MTQATSKRDPANDLRQSLIEALLKIPFANSLTDRRFLISLIRRDATSFPDVQERDEARLHMLALVVACLEHPASLRALRAALMVMAPDEAGTRRVCQLVESASLLSLLPEVEIKRVHELLRRAESRPEVSTWRAFVQAEAPTAAEYPLRLAGAFDQLAATEPGYNDVSPALILVGMVAERLGDPLGDDLRSWLRDQHDRLELPEDFVARVLARPADPALQPPEDAQPPRGTDKQPAPQRTDEEPEATLEPDSASEMSVLVGNGRSPSALDGLVEGDRAGEAMPSVTSTRRPAMKLPQVWGDVPPRNPRFTGRELLLDKLHEDLQAVRETAVLPQALHGMGGVGKSQVAIEYVHRHSGDFDLIWWIPAEQTSQVLGSLAKLAQRLGLDVTPEANSAVPAVREALSTGTIPYENWLLVFDNAESVQDVRSYFPTGGGGKILVTSRNPEWSAVARALEVNVFTRQESKLFLTSRASELSDDDADRLAEALGDLPLAVEQAAAWHAATGMPVDEYLALFEDKRMELLDDTPSPDYQVSVAAAWNVSLDRLEQVNIAALQLLQVCSFFAPEPISREFFAGAPISSITAALDETLRDPIKLGRAIRDIQRYALAKFDHRNNTLQMHRLVQAVLVGRMDQNQRISMRAGAHTLLASANPHSPTRRTRWDRYQALLPHVLVSRAVESTDPNVLDLVFEVVEFLYHWGDHDGALEFAERAYERRLRSIGEEHPQALRLAKYLGYMRWVMGRYASAADLFDRSLELYVAQFGEEDEGTLDAMLLVAAAHRARGEFTEARKVDEHAFSICRRLFGLDDPVTLRAGHNLGVSLRLTADFHEALKRDEETYQRRQDVLGPDDVNTLRTADTLTIDLRESGDYVTAHLRQEETYRRTLAAVGRPENPWAVRAARNLAVARRRAGDHAGALKLAEETVERFRRRYGDDYPDTMAAALNLAVDLRQAGDLEAARDLGEQTLARYQTTLGPNHPHTLAAQTNLAVVLRLQGDVEKARQANKAAQVALAASLGADHAVTLACATNLASDLYSLHETQAAYELDTDTLSRSERKLGVEHPGTLALGVNLALDLRALGREQEADLLHADTMARFRRTLGDQHPATLNALKSVRADCDVDPMPL